MDARVPTNSGQVFVSAQRSTRGVCGRDSVYSAVSSVQLFQFQITTSPTSLTHLHSVPRPEPGAERNCTVMTPTLRSNTTPNGRSGIETTPTKSPRKVPHCTKCQRPRAGHPRQGCPYTQSPRHAAQPVNQDLSASMDSLAISPRRTKLDERRRLPAHEITLASLSTESSDILNRLIQPQNTCEDLSLAHGNVGTGPTPNFSKVTPLPQGHPSRRVGLCLEHSSRQLQAF
jgi:hypothetical protein